MKIWIRLHPKFRLYFENWKLYFGTHHAIAIGFLRIYTRFLPKE